MSFTVNQPLSLLFSHGQFLTHIYEESWKKKKNIKNKIVVTNKKFHTVVPSGSYRSWWRAVRFPVHTLYFPDMQCRLTPCTEKVGKTCWKHFQRIYNTGVIININGHSYTSVLFPIILIILTFIRWIKPSSSWNTF